MGLIDGPAQRDQIEWAALENRLLLLKPERWINGVSTKNGDQDVVEADVHVLDGPTIGEVHAGKYYAGGYVWGVALKDQVRKNIGTGRFNLGRLGKGTASAGQQAPWILKDPSADELALAERYLGSDLYRQNTAAASVVDAPQQAPASQSDPWGSAPAATQTPTGDPWGSSSEPPPF